jgi:uncharacterized repeat protein (TIGR03803 family)
VNATSGVLTTFAEFTGDGAIYKGGQPRAGLTSDGAGNFWGTTTVGGEFNAGTVFKVNASTGISRPWWNLAATG